MDSPMRTLQRLEVLGNITRPRPRDTPESIGIFAPGLHDASFLVLVDLRMDFFHVPEGMLDDLGLGACGQTRGRWPDHITFQDGTFMWPARVGRGLPPDLANGQISSSTP